MPIKYIYFNIFTFSIISICGPEDKDFEFFLEILNLKSFAPIY